MRETTFEIDISGPHRGCGNQDRPAAATESTNGSDGDRVRPLAAARRTVKKRKGCAARCCSGECCVVPCCAVRLDEREMREREREREMSGGTSRFCWKL
eukprot:358487-Chlamydomonas_euryale.AAC.9